MQEEMKESKETAFGTLSKLSLIDANFGSNYLTSHATINHEESKGNTLRYN
jgi:hypothetical protein